VTIADGPEAFARLNAQAKERLGAGDTEGALEAAEAARRLAPDHPEPLLTIATAILPRNPLTAFEAVERILGRDSAHPGALAIRRTATSRMAQAWHFPMMNDWIRNDAYDAAIRRAVTADSLVLDIGTGAGLLSMMAARAGARRVVTCEMTAPVAAKARQIIAANGYQDRVTVHNKRSNDLQVGSELPERADVLVSEVFDCDLLGEGVLWTIEDAHARLIKPGARIIPQAASAMMALVGGEQLARRVRMGPTLGVDLGAFNDFAPEFVTIDGRIVDFDWLSEPAEAFGIDFRRTHYPAQERVLEMRAIRAGFCLGVVQWLRVQLDDVTVFENRPGTARETPTGWHQVFYTFRRPVQVEPGRTLRVLAGHNRYYPYVWLAGFD
jgi:SAM-dependent methyltransferase